MLKHVILLFAGMFIVTGLYAQGSILGNVTSEGAPVAFANVYLNGTSYGTVTDEDGSYVLTDIPNGTYSIVVSYVGYDNIEKAIDYKNQQLRVDFQLTESLSLDEVVITGTLKPVSRLMSPVPVEIYAPAFFRKNPTPTFFEALQNVNGVRPQLNCNVCNTGDIHINGLEGPYTLVLIDGMPIVSGLSTVYGMSGIPSSLIDRVEVVRGPASSLYGSEAVGGLINIITKLPEHTPKLYFDSFVTSWGETNMDVGYRAVLGDRFTYLLGANYFNYSNPMDLNNDNFTDVTLQDRISIFQKISIKRNQNRKLSVAGRIFYEDRWGGEMGWNPSFRGGDEVYGESIYTNRYELFGVYELPFTKKIDFQFSYASHHQNSVYGDTFYLADQQIGFGQLVWNTNWKKHALLFGVTGRMNFYDDNTTATTKVDRTFIPSAFVQDEVSFSEKHLALFGARMDFDSRHGAIFTPRLAYRFKPSPGSVFRVNAGKGFRVVNLFTEEHAALTGAREVIIREELSPEVSYNVNLNYLQKLYSKNKTIFQIDMSAWYTYFTNAIIPDYDTDPNQIIYDNLEGHAISKGFSFNIDATILQGIKGTIGCTFQDVSKTENGTSVQQILTENYSANWALSYSYDPFDLTLDYTGNLYGPMRLPLLGDLDPRREYSPVWSIQNLQFSYDGLNGIEIYGGIKNLLNWTPNKGNPFIIARADDPFDTEVEFDTNGQVIPTENNPYALTFDPSYVFAPNQERRFFAGIRYTLR